MYTIQKNSRSDPTRKESYTGPTWDQAGLRPLYLKQYWDYELAYDIANRLSCVNPVGFVVVKVEG